MKIRPIVVLIICLIGCNVFGQKPDDKKIFPRFLELEGQQINSSLSSIIQEYIPMRAVDVLTQKRAGTDALGFLHEAYQQFYKGIEVDRAVITSHYINGQLQLVSGEYYYIEELDVTPMISERQAFLWVLNHVNANTYVWEDEMHESFGPNEKPKAQLLVVADWRAINPARLAYKFDIHALDPLYRADVYIDAHTGQIIKENEKIHHSDVSATGNSLYNGNVSFTADFTGSNYRLRQNSSGNGVETYDMNNGTSYNNSSDITSGSTNFTSDDTGVQAHWGAEQTHAYYLSNHGRNSYNGNGAVIKSYVHYSSNYVNAFWDGQRMTYGDGDGVNYGPLVSLDIVGHEITHGVTEYSANLVYSYESGALNESFSDIFGEAIEHFATGSNNWQMGTDIGIGGSGAIRSMSNPKAFSNPDTYQGQYWYNGSFDNGGVHTNSGVQNKWFYILSEGESGSNDNGDSYNVTGIGIDNAAAIAYRNLSVYLSSNSQYANARSGAIQAARDLFGVDSPEEIATTDAWYAVGVGNPYGNCSDGIQNGGETDIDCGGSDCQPCPCLNGTSVRVTINFDNYPEETSWEIEDDSGTTVASGGTYGNQPDGSTLNIDVCLPDGCYDFTINDSYGDGLCCGYGIGSYSVTADGNTLASGASFDFSETTNFCLTSAPDPTCDDEIQNGDETGVDCGGPDCPECPTTIFGHYFETGWDGWTDGGDDCERYNGPLSAEGSYSIKIRDNSGIQSAMTSSVYDVNTYTTLELEFQFKAHSMESGEDFWLQYYDGSSWQTMASYVSGTDFQNLVFYTMTVTLDRDNFNFPTNAQFRFQCDATGNGDAVYIDAVVLRASGVVITCNDGIQNGEETGIDCGGPECPACPTTIFGHYFETGWDTWTDGGDDCERYNGPLSAEGNYSIRIRDNSGVQSAMTSATYDVSSYSSLELEFQFKAHSMEPGEDFWLRYFDGSSWQTIATYISGTDFQNLVFYTVTVTMDQVIYNFPTNAQFRFQCDATGNGDAVYIDAVILTGTVQNPLSGYFSFDNSNELIWKELSDPIDDIILYPNPATSMLTLESNNEISKINFYTITGQLAHSIQSTEQKIQIDISILDPGLYILIIESNGNIFKKKVIKQ